MNCQPHRTCRQALAHHSNDPFLQVTQAILTDGRFANTSIAVEGQRRWVWLRGCVASEAQIAVLEQLVRNIDDVEAVIAQLKVMPGGGF